MFLLLLLLLPLLLLLLLTVPINEEAFSLNSNVYYMHVQIATKKWRQWCHNNEKRKKVTPTTIEGSGHRFGRF